MIRRALAAGALLLTVACQRPEVVTRLVPTPVAVPCPEPPILDWPALPLDAVNENTPAGEVAKAYVASIRILKGRLAQALLLLNGYREQTPKTVILPPPANPTEPRP